MTWATSSAASGNDDFSLGDSFSESDISEICKRCFDIGDTCCLMYDTSMAAS